MSAETPGHIERAVPTPKQQKIYDIIANAKAGSLTIIGYGGAVGGGKTRLICELAIDLALDFPGNRILIGRRDYSDLRSTTMDLFDRSCPRQIVAKANMTEHWRKLRLQEWPEGVYSEIHFRELKDYQGIGSEEYGAVLIDEAGEVPTNSARMLSSRLRWKLPPSIMETRKSERWPDGKPMKYVYLAASNPWPGWFEDWFVKRIQPEDLLREAKGAIYFVPSFISDNPYLPENYEELLYAQYPPDWVKRFVEGRWDAFQGQVYPEFSERPAPQGHLWLGKLPPEEDWVRVIGGLDFGGNHPHSHYSAGIVAILLKSNRLIRVAEFEDRGPGVYDRQLAWMLAQQSRWCNRYTGNRIHWVADRSQMVAIHQWKKMGFRVKESKANSKMGSSLDWGISQVRHRLSHDPAGIPGSFYTPDLVSFPERMRIYRYPEPKDDESEVPNKPIKRDDDLVDADRYMHENVENTMGDPTRQLRNLIPVVA